MFPYENLGVYKKSYRANQTLYRFLKGNIIIPPYAKNQLGRASLSVMLNIGEGSAKYSNKELKKELYTAFDEISRILYTMIKNLEK